MPELLVRIDPARPRKAEQLVAEVRAAITDGRLVPGTRLPSSRELAAQIGVSRGVVVTAYEQLVAEGRLTSRQGAGTVVAAVPAPVVGDSGRRHQTPIPTGTGRIPGAGSAELPRDERWKLLREERPELLRPGRPDPRLFPRVVWRRAYETALREATNTELGYGESAGSSSLRAELAGYLGRVRGARTEPSAIVVTTGAAQAFSLLARALREQGSHRIGIEDPGSAIIRIHLAANGLTPVPVPVDRDGVDPAGLARADVDAVLVTPAHQYPTGVVLAPGRRAELVAWARSGDRPRLVIEDDYDAEFRYDREPVGSVQGIAPDVVALVGSASKALAPALRLGWVAVPERLVAPVTAAKRAADHSGPRLEQRGFAYLLESGGYDRHLRQARRIYRQRRDAVMAALRRYLPYARVSGVAAGLHVLVELPEPADDVAIVESAARVGLGPEALSELRVESGPPGLVVGYGGHTLDELSDAIRRLGTVTSAQISPVS